uniref:Uncharacterized protein n=1 Tax=Acrobeloides nanus TaxID=290746 RepID=A0A914CFR6_9BILA
MSEDFLYEDKYCRLTKSSLEIKWYYFPTAQSKFIPIPNIKGVYYKEQVACGEGMCNLKGWGMSLSPCWWACDLLRGLRTTDKFNIVIDTGDKALYCGFSVVDLKNFLDNIKTLLDARIPIEHEFPF